MDFHIHKPQDAAGEGGRRRAFPSLARAAKPTHITKHAVSSEGQAVPAGAAATGVSTGLGTACPRTGWLSAAGHKAVLSPELQVGPPRCAQALPWWEKRELGRDLPLFFFSPQLHGGRAGKPQSSAARTLTPSRFPAGERLLLHHTLQLHVGREEIDGYFHPKPRVGAGR